MRKDRPIRQANGFTLVELMVGMSLALIVMTGMLSSYVLLTRNFTRALGVASATQPPLENQSRIAVGTLMQDVRLATGIRGTLSSSEVTLVIPTSVGTKNITYYYNSGSVSTSVYGTTVQPNSLTRIDRSTSTGLTIQTNLLTCYFTYYDSSGYPYTSYTNNVVGIKGVAISTTSQAGSSANGTLTPVYQSSSAPLLFRNKPPLN